MKNAPESSESHFDEETIAVLLAQLAERDSNLRGQAVERLSQGGVAVLPFLTNVLKDRERWFGGVEVLSRIGEPAVSTLIRALEDPALDNFAAQALGNIGYPAVDALMTTLDHSSSSVRAWAALVLGWIGDKRAVPFLLEHMDSDPNVSEYIAEALKMLAQEPGFS